MVRVNERMEHRGLIWLRPARHGGPADDPAIGKLAIDGVLEAMEPPELALLCETDRCALGPFISLPNWRPDWVTTAAGACSTSSAGGHTCGTGWRKG